MTEQARKASETRYAFELCEVRKQDDGLADYATIRQVDVDPAVLGIEPLKAALRAWALQVLGEGWHEVGLYYAGFSTLDEDDQPHRPVHQLYFAWDGTAELSLAG